MKKKTANVAKYAQKATTLAVRKRGTRRYLRSSSGWAVRCSHQKNAAAAAALMHSSTITLAAPKPESSPPITAKTSAVSAAAPRIAPGMSTRCASGSALSGSTISPATSAARPKNRLNQKIARQSHTPTSAPPKTGPTARARPDTAVQTPRALVRVRSSVYRCRSIDSVPGSLAAAPSPITAIGHSG